MIHSSKSSVLKDVSRKEELIRTKNQLCEYKHIVRNVKNFFQKTQMRYSHQNNIRMEESQQESLWAVPPDLSLGANFCLAILLRNRYHITRIPSAASVKRGLAGKETAMKAMLFRKVPMSDGVNLATDVWLPDGPGPFPVLLTRTPYHRRGAASRAHVLTEWGYAYVVQDVRGKYDSEGTFRPLVDEAEDGAATLDWIADRKWCNGRIGMVGLSYLGIVQVPAASSGHEALRCIVPGVAPNSFFTDWIRYDGCFALANAVRWSMTAAVCPTQPALDHFTWEQLWRQPTLEDVFERAGYECPTLRKWVSHDRYDAYWERIDQHRMYPRVNVPGLHVGGWFDHLTRGQFQAYRGIRDRGKSELARNHQRLLIGPWGHKTIGR